MTTINSLRVIVLLSFCVLLASCGFHLQGQTKLAAPLHRLYLQTSDPYGQLARSLQQYLKASNVELTSSPQEADTILEVMSDSTSQNLLSVNGTQQTRQYSLVVTTIFQITNRHGGIILGPQSLSESRAITIQSNQVLGSSNEANLFYQQMRRNLAYAIINRIASREVNQIIVNAFTPHLNGTS